MKVKCHFCNSNTNKVEKAEAVVIEKKNFHPECAQLFLDKKELSETICRIFDFKTPGPRNNTLIANYLKAGKTYKGINNALVYFYEIKNNNVNKANSGIGIVPYVYEEAQKAMKYEKKKEDARLEAAEKNSAYEIRTVILKDNKKEKKIPSYLKIIEFEES